MDQTHSSWRTDEQLQAILFETADWTVNGSDERALCLAPSLARALARAVAFAMSGAVVTAISRSPGGSILVFPDQIDRLRKLLAGREVSPLRQDRVAAGWPG